MVFAGNDLPTAFDAKTCIRKGLCPITKLRGQEDFTTTGALESHSLYFEQHGKGTKYKIVFIMGLNSSSFSWRPQVEYFGGGKAFLRDGEELEEEKSSVLVFDNRGVGNSGYPKGPYSTSGMAEDLICLLDYVGWKGERDVHVVGIGLGGMIAQELALRIPERIASLMLAVTAPSGRPWNNLPPWKGVSCLVKLMLTPDPIKKAPIVMDMLYTEAWLEEPDEDEPGKTNRQVQTYDFLRRVAITKPQDLLGYLSKAIAGLTHSVSREGLRKISGSIPKVTIVTGDEDHLVRPSMSYALKESMPKAEVAEWNGTGHGLHAQRRRWFNELIERTTKEGRSRCSSAAHPQPQQTQPSTPSATPVGLSNSTFTLATETQSKVKIPLRPASTPRTTTGSAAESSSAPPLTLPPRPHRIGTKNPFASFITPAPAVPKPLTTVKIAPGFGGAGSAPFSSTPPSQQPPQKQQSGQPGQSTSRPTGGFNYVDSAFSALNLGGTDMGSAASSFANANANAKSHCETATATPPTGSTRTGSTVSSSSFGGSSGLASQSATRISTSTSTGTDPASAGPQETGFAGLKPSKRTSLYGAALMKSLPPLPNQSGPTSPPSTTGSSASTIGPPAVSQLDRDAAIATKLQRQFEAEDKQLRAQRQALQRFSVVFFKCCICMELHPEDSVARIEKCRHAFCRDCLRRYTTSKISERCFPIVCPVCTTEKGRPDPGLVDETIIQQLGISNNHYQIFEELQTISFSVPVHCRRCEQTMLIDREEFQETKEITCPLPGCQYVWCKACQQPIKADGPKHSCDGANELQHLMQEQGWKICPGCQTPVQKTGGCNHMSCVVPGCNSHFCYVDGVMILKGGTREEIQSAKMNHYRKCKLFDYD